MSRLPQRLQHLPVWVQLAMMVALYFSVLGGAALLAYLRHVAPVGWTGWPCVQ